MNNSINTIIEEAWQEYLSLPDNEWRKDFFCDTTGGFVATHVLKVKDALKRHGIVAEVEACRTLALMGKRILRLPENIFDKIDSITIDRKKYRELLKFKEGSIKPRGYPDVFFDGQTWDFKTSTFRKEDTIRQLLKDGRKADNVIFILNKMSDLDLLLTAIKSEYGMRKKDGSWVNLPNTYCMSEDCLWPIWEK